MERFCRSNQTDQASFFANSKVELQKKVCVGSSLVLSKELFGAGSWPQLTTSEHSRLHANVTGFFRVALNQNFVESSVSLMRDVELYRINNLHTPLTFVRFARLRLSVKLVRL